MSSQIFNNENLEDDTSENTSIYDLLKTVNKDKVDVIEVIPIPGFVIKTFDENKQKTFINICGCNDISAPGNWKNGNIPIEVKEALNTSNPQNQEFLRFNIILQLNNLSSVEIFRFPLSVDQGRFDVDKKGDICVVFDCLLNSDIVKQAQSFRKLKKFIIGLALGWISEKNEIKLDNDYKLPKMKYKGKKIEKQRIKRQKNLIREVKEVEEEPSFPLSFEKQHSLYKTIEPEPNSKLTNEILEYTVDFEGTPFNMISICFTWKPLIRGIFKPNIEIHNFDLNADFGVFGHAKLKLPLFVDAEKAKVEYSIRHGTLAIEIPYKPILDIINNL